MSETHTDPTKGPDVSDSEMRYSEGRSRQVSIRAGYRAMRGSNAIYLSELRELVERTKDWPSRSSVQVTKSSLTGDQITVTDTRNDWTDR